MENINNDYPLQFIIQSPRSHNTNRLQWEIIKKYIWPTAVNKLCAKDSKVSWFHTDLNYVPQDWKSVALYRIEINLN